MNIFSLKILLFYLLFNSIFHELSAQKKIDTIVQKATAEYMNNKAAVGMSVGILLTDQQYTYNFGISNTTDSLLPTATTIYSMGSVSKTFVALLLAKAVNDHNVSLNDV